MSQSSRRHVVVLNQFALPLSQGGGTRHTELFSRLDGWSHQIIAGNRNHYTQEVFRTQEKSFRLVPVSTQRGGAAARLAGWVAYSAQAFWHTVRAPRVDVVYASTPHPLTPLAGWAAARVRRAPFVLEVRDLWPESIVSAGKLKRGSAVHRILSAVERFSVRQADQVVGVTEGWDSHFRALGSTPFHVVPNGAEFRGKSAGQPARDLSKLRPDVAGPFGIFAGAHGPKDGIDAILDAASAHPTVGFTLIGSGVMKDPAKERVQREGLSNVTFLDPVPKAELAGILAAFDFGIHAVSPLNVFSKGMSPNKLFDYLAHDMPVVSNAGGALDRIVGDGPIGVVTSDLAVSVARFLETGTDEKEKWATNRRNLMTGRYSRTSSARTLKGILDAAVASRTASRRPRQRRRPRVVHVSSAHGPVDNRILRKECRALSDAGFDVHLVTRGPKQQVVPSVQHHVIERAPTGRLARMAVGPWKAILRALKLRPQIVHLHDPELIPLGLLVELMTPVKVVFDAHEDLPAQVMGKHYLPKSIRPAIARFASLLENVAGRCLSGVVAATPAVGRSFPPARTAVVKNFPWMGDYGDLPVRRETSGEPFTFGYVGAMSRIRGIDEMIAATAGYRLLLAGQADEYARRAIERAGDHVEYVGAVSADRIPSILAQMDAGLVLLHDVPNYRESIPTKLIEYMASGIPFIATDFEAWRVLVDREDVCIFVDVSKPQEVCEAVEQMASGRGEATRRGRRGRELFESNLTFDSQAGALVDFYRSLV
ncbi:glycosyltransferase involved in cell wall biosynthesis [Brachybacterium sp. AG952]|uniref:glycosyltransferase n=1 Tax=Brachybacterium sp. AG952 TaxID=2183989 RepID=UPI0010604CD5|nr:glycosyltransferase [Brachybacterium sp. AG952]TDP80075.1 glycosyltransferase involved in cell wall biosynthesis [Brachybacterium sp. AG952]